MRNQIYKLLVKSEHGLVPYHNRHGREEAGDRHRAGRANLQPFNITILLLNKQIYHEAASLFYPSNKFTMQYDDFCSCWSSVRPSYMLNNIKQLTIQDVNFDINFDEDCEPSDWDRCHNCETDAFGLLKSLNALPNLVQVTLAFEDIESYALCLRTVTEKLEKLGRHAMFEAAEVGRVSIAASRKTFELNFPPMLRTWPSAYERESEVRDDEDEEDLDYFEGVNHLPAYDQKVYSIIRDILYTAQKEVATTRALRKLMFKFVLGVSFNKEDGANLTTALAECIADMIDEDESVEMSERTDLVDVFSVPP